MAINTFTAVIIAGAASSTQATAISNSNTAIATFFANGNKAIWNPTYTPVILTSGLNSDAGSFTGWYSVTYLSAS